MRIGRMMLVSSVAVSLTTSGVLAAPKQTCTTDPYGTPTCTNTPDTKAPTPKKQKVKKAPAK